VPTGPGFGGSAQIANSNGGATDMVKYQDGVWQGVNSDVSNGLVIAPPIVCDASKAAWMRVLPADTIGEGIGFKLSSALVQGNLASFQLTYVSHGVGSTGSFQPVLYTHNSNDFMVGGEIQAAYATTCPAAGTDWLTQTVNFNVGGLNAGDNWLFVYAPENSGLLFNLCQLSLGAVDYGPVSTIHICEGESAIIGQDLGSGITYNWTGGATSSTIEVSTSGVYLVQAANNCNSDLGAFPVVVHGEPELHPSSLDTVLCEGQTLTLSSIGLNPVATWPDGSTDSTFVVVAEGEYAFSITDDCDTYVDMIVVDFDTIPVVDLGPDIALCPGQSTILDATTVGADTYEWQSGHDDPTFLVTWEATFSVTASNDCGSHTDAIFVEYSETPDTILPTWVDLCLGRDLILDVSDIEASYYLWSDGSDGPTVSVEYVGFYWVEIQDDDFCFTVRDTVWILEGYCECPLFMPNAFTPDGDGLNDTFHAQSECEPYDFLMEIYDRWGVMVYRSIYPSIGWNGKLHGEMSPPSVYSWRIWYRESYDGIPIEKYGSVALIGGKAP
jgi:gliding motility-associated-like protein